MSNLVHRLGYGDRPDPNQTMRPITELLADAEDDVLFHVHKGGVAWASPSAARLLGVAPDDLIGANLGTFIEPGDLARVEESTRQMVLAGKAIEVLDIHIRTSDGSYKSVRARLRPLRDSEGLISGTIVGCHDTGDSGSAAARAFATLAEGTRVLLRSTTEQDLLEQMCEAVCRTSGYTFAWYGKRIDDPDHSVRLLAVGGDDRGYTDTLRVTWGDDPTAQGPTGRALRTGTTQVMNDLATDPKFAPWRSAAVERGIECSVALPVWCEGAIHGAFMVYASQPNVFDEQAVELLEYLAADIGYGLSRLRGIAALAASEQRFRLLAENATDVVFLSGPDLALEWVSPSVTGVTGWTPDQLEGKSIAADYLHPDDVQEIRALLANADPQETLTRRLRMRCADDSYRWMSVSGRGVINPDGTVRGRVVSMRDIQKQVEAEEDLRNREQQYRLLAENATDLVFSITADGIITWVSPSVTSVLGLQPADLVGKSAAAVMMAQDLEVVDPTLRRMRSGQSPTQRARLRCADGRVLWVEATLRPVADLAGEVTGGIVAVRDVDEQVRAEERLQREVAFDALTGLAKKPLAIARIQEILDSRSEPGWALLCVGVRGMRAINQAFTYEAGDEVLRTVARRLVAAAGAPDRVGRIAGDEFVILLRDVVTTTDAAAAAERLISAVRGPVELSDDTRVEVSTYVGIAPSSPAADAEELLRDATTAMRGAGVRGPDRWTFLDQSVASRTREDLDLQTQLRAGIDDGQVVAWFMPIIALADNRLQGYEALVRWVRPDGTVMVPPSFLDVAERSHLILDVDRLVLDQALAALLRAEPTVHVAVNISAATLQTGQVDDIVLAALERSGVNPRRLHLEVTETALFRPTPEVVAAMHALAAVGISWWVDDFGTGFSSISHLRDLPITGLKLDRSFTSDLADGSLRAHQLAQGLAGLAKGLDLRTIAEGVETEEQARILSEQGWEMGQGWLFGKPTPAS